MCIDRYIMRGMAGRPREFDRERAVQTAMDAFWRDGYHATSVAALTRAIGINPPSLYAAFGDKPGLFDEAAACYVQRLSSGLSDVLSATTTARALADLMRVTAESHTDPDTPPGCLVLSEPRLAPQRSQMRARITERIAQGQRDGDVADDVSPDQTAALVDVIMAGMSARARDGADRATLTDIANLAAHALTIILNPSEQPS